MNLDDREKFLAAIFGLLVGIYWYRNTNDPHSEPLLLVLTALNILAFGVYRFHLKNTGKEPKEPKELNNIPDRLTDGFVGRTQDIKNIEDRLLAHHHVVIRGIGGLGKTSLAQAYIRQYRKYFDHIVYISVVLPPDQDYITDNDFREYILQGFTFDKVLLANLDIKPDVDAKNIDIFKAVCDKLTQVEGTKNLLVIDNGGSILADSIFMDELPKRPQWHILCTSRHEIANFDTYTLETLSLPEAQLLFENGYKVRIDDYVALENIFEAVSYLTVAIDLLAKTAKSADLSVSDLWKRVEIYSLDFNDAAKVRAGQNNEAKTPAEHIIGRFVLQELNDLEKSRLLPLSILPSVPIEYEQLLAWLQIPDDDKPDFKDVLNRLCEKGWIQKNNNRATITISCHPIIQFATRKQLNPNIENCAILIDSFCKLLAIDEEKGEHGVFKKELLFYGEAVFKAVYKENTNWTEQDKNLAVLADKLGWVYGDLGFFNKSIEYRLISVDIGNHILEPNSNLLAEFCNNIAVNYSRIKAYQAGLEYALKALTIRKKVLPKRNNDLANAFNSVGLNYYGLSEYQKSLNHFLKASTIWEYVLSENNPNLATSYNNIAAAYHGLKKYQESLQYHIKSLKIRENNLPENHPNLAQSYSNIAATYWLLNDLKTAKGYIDKSVVIRKSIFDETHPLLLKSFKKQTEINKALQELEKEKDE
jgi:tetratricopeptide (TPR) repeat protein